MRELPLDDIASRYLDELADFEKTQKKFDSDTREHLDRVDALRAEANLAIGKSSRADKLH